MAQKAGYVEGRNFAVEQVHREVGNLAADYSDD
jgi:hypothetical protein